MTLLYIFIFVLGAVLGSFLSSYTYRILSDKSVSDGRSFCPTCKKKIEWRDNIPILSFLLLKGRCRKCGKKISVRYPLLELTTGVLFLSTFIKSLSCGTESISGLGSTSLICSWTSHNFLSGLVILMFLNLMLVSVFIIDLEYMIIPDSLVFVSLTIFYVFVTLYFSETLFTHLLTGFSTSLFLLLLNLLTLGRGMGLGDVKFAILGGFILGYKLSIIWIFLSFIIGAVVGLVLLSIKKAKFGKQIPFGPYLVIAFVVILFFGPELYRILNLPF